MTKVGAFPRFCWSDLMNGLSGMTNGIKDWNFTEVILAFPHPDSIFSVTAIYLFPPIR